MIDSSRRMLISLKPRFAGAILAGTKTLELRRVRPRIEMPTEALLYASSPERSLVGTCHVVDIVDYTPAGLWRAHGAQTGVSFAEFSTYFEGSARAYGLVLTNARRLKNDVSLRMIRSTWHGFQPPQSFRYLTRSRSDEVLDLAS